MADIINICDARIGQAATLLTSAGLYSGRIVSVADGLVEMEDVMFYAYVNPTAAFPLRHLYLREGVILGFADPIGQPSR